jgi:SAM-dependent methyltransferase
VAQPVEYDAIAAAYDGRYERNDYSGVQAALRAFVGHQSSGRLRVAEVGCGTGHWIEVFHASAIPVVGIDASAGMLQISRARLPGAPLIRARAEALPFLTSTFDRLFLVNALHHFSDPDAFFHDARRLLADGGGLLTVGLDPSTGLDQWWIYDYFASTVVRDRERYLPAARIRELMHRAGFERCDTHVVQHRPAQMTVEEADRRGFLDRSSTSQLMSISDSEYEEGLKRVRQDDMEARGRLILRSDLRVYGTVAWVR